MFIYESAILKAGLSVKLRFSFIRMGSEGRIIPSEKKKLLSLWAKDLPRAS
jgi:hypothetical protein